MRAILPIESMQPVNILKPTPYDAFAALRRACPQGRALAGFAESDISKRSWKWTSG
jgi:hypothetical protein